jgi:hypothetical protein
VPPDSQLGSGAGSSTDDVTIAEVRLRLIARGGAVAMASADGATDPA